MKKLTILCTIFSLIGFSASAKDNKSLTPEDKLFDMIDSNRDGVLSRDELKAHHKKAFDKIDNDHDGKISEQESNKANTKSSYDTHGDKTKKGHLTFEETLAHELTRFEKADKNHDDKITKEEYHTHNAEYSKH